jgi:hypothetical protein
MEYSKSKLALIQLEKAMEVFFEEKDYISAITLAGASEEITRCMLEREGKATAVDDLKEWLENNHPGSDVHESFYKKANKTRNSLKHFTDASEANVFVDEAETIYWLTRAVINYDRAHVIQTKPIIKYISWLKERNA